MSDICYFRSGSNSFYPQYYGPCDPMLSGISLCCGVGDYCLPSGLCVTQSGIYYSGGCTDSTYENAICPNFCTSGENPAMDRAFSVLTCVIGDANWVVECPFGTAVNAGDFCCSINQTAKSCCDTASNGLGLGASISSAQVLVMLSAEAKGLPASATSGATISSSRSITGWHPFSCKTEACVHAENLQIILRLHGIPTSNTPTQGSLPKIWLSRTHV